MQFNQCYISKKYTVTPHSNRLRKDTNPSKIDRKSTSFHFGGLTVVDLRQCKFDIECEAKWIWQLVWDNLNILDGLKQSEWLLVGDQVNMTT